jgi:hydrogenase maturation protease
VNQILVIGYGNTLRGDDGAGVAAAKRIAERFPQVDVMTVHQLQPELAETITWYDTVFFIDASVSVREIQITALAPEQEPRPGGTHATTPAMLVALSSELYSRRPDNVFLGAVPASVCDHGESFSSLTAKKVEECVDRFALQLLTLNTACTVAVHP